MTLAPARLLLPMRAVEQGPPAAAVSSASLGSGAGSFAPFSFLLHSPRHKLWRSSGSVIASVGRVQEDSRRGQLDEPQRRFGRGGRRPAGGGGEFRDTRTLPPWKSKYRQFQTGRERQRGEKDDPHSGQELSAGDPDGEVRRYGSPERSNFARNGWQQAYRNSPTAPWQRERREEAGKGSNGRAVEEEEPGEKDGYSEKSAMERIVEKLRSIEEATDASKQTERQGLLHSRTPSSSSHSSQEPFSVRKTWSRSGPPSPEPISDTRFPWEKEEDGGELEAPKEARVRSPTLAELTIPGPELKRLRALSLQLKKRLKIGRLGVTSNIALSIKDAWRTCEVVKVKCDGSPAFNMKKTHEDLERMTGGLVIWRSGSAAVIYRGTDYGQAVTATGLVSSLERKPEGMSSSAEHANIIHDQSTLDEPQEGDDVHREENDASEQSISTEMTKQAASHLRINDDYEMEVESILQELGPRYEEWTGVKPLPVDGDLLPATIPNYRPPFRLLPYGVKPTLGNMELTKLRRLARPLAPHFVLGRNRGQHGLAAAIAKLWERSEIAKIAVKRGVQNTNNERMAEELKRLTGGILLSRDKEFITLYRGKDFLPKKVAAALIERETMVRALQEEEERARADRNIAVRRDTGIQPSVAVITDEVPNVEPSYVQLLDHEEQIRLRREAAKARRLERVRMIERKIALALKKKEKARIDLEKVEQFLKPVERPADVETITEEERFMFRKLGLKMRAFLLVGRRGVFDGVVQNMHLHWKHRELVKLIIKEKDPMQLHETARMLEYESGGVLVAVESTSKGQAIVVYRGKNYRRPADLRPKNLLTKRKALQRSLEIQRRAGLSAHIRALEEEIAALKVGLSKVNEEKDSDSNQDVDDDYGGSSLEDQEGEVQSMTGENFSGSALPKDETTTASPCFDKEKLKQVCRLGPIFRAEPPTKSQIHELRQEALKLRKAAQFHVGSDNFLTGLAKAIRLYFLDHALVKIGVRGRGLGKSVQDVAFELEDLTGGAVVSQDPTNILMYRGWPSGQDMPMSDIYNVLSPELRDAFEEEDDWENYHVHDDRTVEDESDVSVTENDQEEEDKNYIVGMLSDVDNSSDYEAGENDEGEDIFEWDSDSDEVSEEGHIKDSLIGVRHNV